MTHCLIKLIEKVQPKRNHQHVAVTLEQIYFEGEEFSFEELLVKKRGLYGLKFEVDRQKSPVENDSRTADKKSPQDVLAPKFGKSRSPVQHVLQPKPERSPLQRNGIVKTPSPHSSPAVPPEHHYDDIVYMPIRGS
jgi:hypothetical protein